VSETVSPQLLVQSGTPRIIFPIARYPTCEDENKTTMQLMAYEDLLCIPDRRITILRYFDGYVEFFAKFKICLSHDFLWNRQRCSPKPWQRKTVLEWCIRVYWRYYDNSHSTEWGKSWKTPPPIVIHPV